MIIYALAVIMYYEYQKRLQAVPKEPTAVRDHRYLSRVHKTFVTVTCRA